MAKSPIPNRPIYPHRPVMQPPKPPEPRFRFNSAWIIVPLCLVGMFFVLSNISPSLTWDGVMEFLGIQDKKRYTSLFLLCLSLTFVISVVRILGPRKH